MNATDTQCEAGFRLFRPGRFRCIWLPALLAIWLGFANSGRAASANASDESPFRISVVAAQADFPQPISPELEGCESPLGRAKWVQTGWGFVSDNADVIRRKESNKNGEILIWASPNDPNWSQVKTVAMGMDHRGISAVFAFFDESGSDNLARFTEQNVGRSLAIIINGRIMQIEEIKAPFSSSIMIRNAALSDFRPFGNDKIEGGVIYEPTSMAFTPNLGRYFQQIDTLIIFLVSLFVLFLAHLGAARRPATSPLLWRFTLTIMLCLAGAYLCGVDVQHNSPVSKVVRFGIIPGLYGGLAGLLIGRWASDMTFQIFLAACSGVVRIAKAFRIRGT